MGRFGWSKCAGVLLSLFLGACGDGEGEGEGEGAEVEALWSAPEPVSDGQGEFAISPHVAAHPAGVHLVWAEGSEDVMTLRTRHFDIPSNQWEETRDLGPADADWTGDGLEVAADSAGNALVVWLDGDEEAIWAARYDREEDRWDEPSLLDATGRDPHVVMDADGNALAVWTHIEGGVQVYAAHMTSEGAWSQGQPIDAAAQAGSLQTDVVLHADGGATAFMVQRVATDIELAQVELVAVRYLRDQDEWTPPVALQGAEVGEYFDISLGGNARGDAVLYWSLVPLHDNEEPSMYVAAYDSSSSAWTEPDRLTGVGACRGAFALENDGRTTVVCSHDKGSGSEISAIRLDGDHGFGAVESVVSAEDLELWEPAVLALEDGMMAIWPEDNGVVTTLRSSSFRDDSWQTPEVVGPAPDGVTELGLVSVPGAGVLAYWTTLNEIVTSWHP